MSDDVTSTNVVIEDTENKGQDSQQTEDPVQKLVREKVAEAIGNMKENLDKAYKGRDDALRKVAEMDQVRKEAELKRLQDEGKHKEALELQLAEERAKREALETRTIELTRDLELRNALQAYTFRNDSASDMAYREIVTQLVRNEQGVWLHKSGIPLRDFVKQFTDNESNSFLLKPKASNGSGSTSVGTTNTSSTEKKSLFSMSQEDVMKMAREGKLPTNRR
jgi:hypothetical protein